ncbi:hypothetical protein ABT160_38080 [Streptomyces sp. NPDC001941]|uniref:hypothetical protein n=1 Tax=Streptomyces sp. NPDC001941 TaxID=3154659 RepID=UPI00331D32AF
MTSRLIDQRPIHYTVSGQPPIVRHCRTWALADGTTLTLVTEFPADQGMSITNAAEAVRETLEEQWGTNCRIVEHYPWPDGEHYDEQFRTPTNGIQWRRLNPITLRAELGSALDDTRPDNPQHTA